MASRPLFSKKGQELQALFESSRGDRKQLEALLHELSFRTTPGARALRTRVEQAIANLPPTVESTQKSDIPQFVPTPPPRLVQTTFLPPLSTDISANTQNSAQSLRANDTKPEMGQVTIQPLSVRGRPVAWSPPLKDDLRLSVKPTDPPSARFRAALVELIRELKKKNNGTQQFLLADGERIAVDVRGYAYQFEFSEEANLFESAKVVVAIGGTTVAGQITALFQGRIIVTLEDDFGPVIKNCVLRIDNTALLQALHDRLQNIDAGQSPSFRTDFANAVLENKGTYRPPAPPPTWPWKPLPNDDQQEFVRTALANDITWLWGPPGTGKTDVLALFTRLQYDDGKRVLICSNTNQAVDQLLLKLCQKMEAANESALEQGHILRLGRIEHDDLREGFEAFITIDGIVARRSTELMKRKRAVEDTLVQIAAVTKQAKDVLALFGQLDAAQAALTDAAKAYANAQVIHRNVLSAIRNSELSCQGFRDELNKVRSSNAFWKLFLRDEASIERDIDNAKKSLIEVQQRADSAAADIAAHEKDVEQRQFAVNHLATKLSSVNRSQWQAAVDKKEKQRVALQSELAQIAEQLKQIEATVLSEARILGATVTRTFLRPDEFNACDTVIVDEASMILLPAIFHAAGMAQERVVVAGDFRQLPPIVQTEQKAIVDELGNDVFTRAGIAKAVKEETTPPRLVMLRQQYRMNQNICRLVSVPFYKDKVKTAPERLSEKRRSLPRPFDSQVVLIDTSSVYPFTTRNAFGSHLNLMHALVVRNLLFFLNANQNFRDVNGANAIGVCSPYAAQSRLLRAIADGQGWKKTLRVSTVHRFQGDERETMVVDLVDSIGEFNVGLFLQANSLDAQGAKLFNVAFSRAKENLIVVGNLSFLDEKLPGDALLRGLLYDAQAVGKTIDARDVLAMYPISADLERFGTQIELDFETRRTGLFRDADFWRTCRQDIAKAQKSVVIFSGFITAARTAEIGDCLRERIIAGVKVRCVTRAPAYNGGIPVEVGRSALCGLEGIGATIDLRQDIHEKVVIVDGRIVWFGSLNPLSHASKTSEMMARVDNDAFATQVAQFLALRPRTVTDDKGVSFAEKENPSCPICGGRTVLRRGQYGRFFACEDGKHWTESVDRPTRKRGRNAQS